MRMCFCVLVCYTQVKNMRVQYKALICYLKIFYLVMFFCIQYMFSVSCQPLAQMNIVTVTAEACTGIRFNLNGPFFYFIKNVFVRKNHNDFAILLNSSCVGMTSFGSK